MGYLELEELKSKHKLMKHPHSLDDLTTKKSIAHYFPTKKGMTIKEIDAVMTVAVPIFLHNPQLWVLNVNNTNTPDNLFELLVYGCYTENSIQNLAFELLETYFLNNDYACHYCGEEYDSFPSIELVHCHMKNCTVIRDR